MIEPRVLEQDPRACRKSNKNIRNNIQEREPTTEIINDGFWMFSPNTVCVRRSCPGNVELRTQSGLADAALQRLFRLESCSK